MSNSEFDSSPYVLIAEFDSLANLTGAVKPAVLVRVAILLMLELQ